MNNKKIIILYLFIILTNFIFSKDNEDHLFWEIESNDSKIYLLASVVSFDKNSFPLNNTIEQNFKNSEYIVVNSCYFGGTTKQTRWEIEEGYPITIEKRGYLDNTLLTKILTKKEYDLYKNKIYIKYGINLDYYNNHKLWYIALALYYLNWKRSLNINFRLKSTNEVKEKTFETYFIEKIKKRQKGIVIESYNDVINYLDNFPLKAQKLYLNYAINQNINELIKGKELLSKLSKKGDYNGIENYLLEKIKKDKEFELLYVLFYRNKNQKILLMMEDYLKKRGKYFVILNINYLIDEYGILNLLNKKGYKIKKIYSKK